MKRNSFIMFTLSIAAILCVASRGLPAGEVWTPSTGDVDLDEPTEAEPYAQYKHAAALLASGEPRSAAKQLTSLIQEHPDASWIDDAHYLLGLARFNLGSYKPAFIIWQELQNKGPESDRAQHLFQLQKKALTKIARRDLDSALPLYDQLVEVAPDQSSGAQAQKAKADALFEDKRFRHASDQYLALIDYFPGSTSVPYAWYKIGVSELEMAKWIGRGTDRLTLAIQRFRDFIHNFPEHRLVSQAREKLKEAQRLRMEKYSRIAEYYLGPARQPSAALPYLQEISHNLPDERGGKWAKEQIQDTETTEKTPRRGRVRPMSLPGVTDNNEKEDNTE
ncbi:MAG: outer membrane protein assembly factor BamD [Planctomycetota bacterium]